MFSKDIAAEYNFIDVNPKLKPVRVVLMNQHSTWNHII